MVDHSIILAIDTAGPDCSACLYDGQNNNLIAIQTHTIGRGHAEFLPGIVDQVLDDAKLSFADISRLAVTEGPGSFAGIRVGIAFTRALALALDIPAIGVSSLQALAYPHCHHDKNVMAVLDARRNQVYVTLCASDHSVIIPPSAITPEDALELVPYYKPLICGNGAEIIQSALSDHNERLDVVCSSSTPKIEVVAKLANACNDDKTLPAPQYLRAADAKPQLNFALSRV